MRRVVIGGEWMFLFFFFSLLAFSLVYFVGLVSQSSDIPLSSKSHINNKAFHNSRREDIPSEEKNIPVQAKCKLMGSLKFRIANANMNWKNAYTQSSLIHGFCLIFFYIVKKWIFFVFTWIFSSYLSASQPQIVTQGSEELQ